MKKLIALSIVLSLAACGSDNVVDPEPTPPIGETPVQPILPSHPIEPESGSPELPWLPEQPIENDHDVHFYVCTLGMERDHNKTYSIIPMIDGKHIAPDRMIYQENEVCIAQPVVAQVGDTVELEVFSMWQDTSDNSSGEGWYALEENNGNGQCFENNTQITFTSDAQQRNVLLMVDVNLGDHNCEYTWKMTD